MILRSLSLSARNSVLVKVGSGFDNLNLHEYGLSQLSYILRDNKEIMSISY